MKHGIMIIASQRGRSTDGRMANDNDVDDGDSDCCHYCHNKWNEFKSGIRLNPSTETKNDMVVEVVVCWLGLIKSFQ